MVSAGLPGVLRMMPQFKLLFNDWTAKLLADVRCGYAFLSTILAAARFQ
jgi:hypothetical protein